ncbi:COG1361 family protein [Natronococcus jeotgali]|uniref:Alpha-galactosidase NEW3 domain-containing protein n=1 Tax=Natronococcus jeotgali DSM 18795 TaxID=1227498 RepID=L9XH39_9EURY|nr:hypothetical protein [Natronococcus jeotgali]ELY61015.1 hypothetical protein C492_09745 [Natronococcus jeotgali DSM 18795]
MGRRGETPSRRRRVVVAAGVLSLVVVLAIGTVAATVLLETQTTAPPQNESRNDSVDGPTAEPIGGAPPVGVADNESATGPPAENDTPTTEPPIEPTVPATDPQIVQGPTGNVTVAVAENRSVRAGESRPIPLEVTNDGDRRATDVVVTLRAADGAVALGTSASPQSARSIVVDELSSGETADVDVDVTAARVEPGTYPLFASVQYRLEPPDDGANESDDGDEPVRTGGPSVLGVGVVAAPDFDVAPVTDGVPVDGERVYEVRIENVGDRRVTGVTAAIEVGPPLSSESPTAYVGALDPGESATARFDLEASSDAVETTTSVPLSIAYDGGSGERTSADPVQVPVAIVETDGDADADSAAPFVAVALALALATVWWVRRR